MQRTFWVAWAAVVSSIIGPGVFTAIGFQAELLESEVSILTGWLIGGFIAIAGAICYADISNAMPAGVGEYHYVGKLFHQSAGVLSGWITLISGFIAHAALSAHALEAYLEPLLPVNSSIVIIGILLLLALSHSLSQRFSGRIQFVMSAGSILFIILFSFAVIGSTGTTEITQLAGSFNPDELTSASFALALPFVYYAYTGWNASIYLVREIPRAREVVPLSMLIGTLTVIGLYFLLNTALLLSESQTELAGNIHSGYIAAYNMFGTTGGQLVSVIVAFLLIASISVTIWIGSGLMTAMRQDLSGRSSKHLPRSPHHALIFAGIAILLLLTAGFEPILYYSTLLMTLIVTVTVAGWMWRRTCRPLPGGAQSAIIFWPLAVLFIAFQLILMFTIIIEKPAVTVATLLTITVAVLFYLMRYTSFLTNSNP